MTKQAYFELCEMMGTEPAEEDIPVEFGDFPILVQQVLTIYNYLPDKWDPMGGNYMGKDLAIVFKLFDTFLIEDVESRISLELISYIDNARQKILNKKEPKKPSKP